MEEVYPCIKKFEYGEDRGCVIVLFLCYKEGYVVGLPSHINRYSLGDFRTDWTENHFDSVNKLNYNIGKEVLRIQKDKDLSLKLPLDVAMLLQVIKDRAEEGVE